MTIHVCAPSGFRYRTIRHCPYCERRRRFVVHTFVWYGPEVMCGGCGNQWSDGERRRLTNKAKAVNRHVFQGAWSKAKTRAEMLEWLERELDAM